MHLNVVYISIRVLSDLGGRGVRRRSYCPKNLQSQNSVYFRGVARIFSWGGPKYRFQNFGKCNLGEYPLPPPPGNESSRGGWSGYFPKLPKRVCAAQQGHDFGTLLFTTKLGLSCCVSTCLLLREAWVKP